MLRAKAACIYAEQQQCASASRRLASVDVPPSHPTANIFFDRNHQAFTRNNYKTNKLAQFIKEKKKWESNLKTFPFAFYVQESFSIYCDQAPQEREGAR